MTHKDLRRRRPPQEERTWPLMEREDLMRSLVWDGKVRCAAFDNSVYSRLGKRGKAASEITKAKKKLEPLPRYEWDRT